jgi:Motility quorum-sensing regulator, toxin of MqsA
VPRWLPKLLRRVHELAGRGRVRFTLKAARELAALGAGLDVQNACDALVALRANDFAKRFESEITAEWMYVFKPSIAGTVVYLKLVLRAECLVVSFHEDEGESDEEPS